MATPVDYGSGPWGGYNPATASTTPDGVIVAADVWMFGDSIARRVQNALAKRMLDERDQILAVDNCGGRRSAETVNVLAAWLQRFPAPAHILMGCGTNDIFEPPAMAAQVYRAMSLVPSTTTVWWRDVQACRVGGTEARRMADQRNSGWVNAQIRDGLARWDNLRVIGWAASLAAKPGRLTAYLEDGVHPNDAGVAYHNEVVLKAMVTTSPAPTPASVTPDPEPDSEATP